MNFFEAVFGKGPAPAPAGAPAPSPGPAPGSGTGTNTDPGIKAPPADSGTGDVKGKGTESPLDSFKDLFTIDPKSGDSPPRNPFDFDPAVVKKNADSMDFTKSIDSETLERVRQGGEEGITAMLSAMNRMSQTNYAYAAMMASNLAKESTKHVLNEVQNLVPDLIRKSRANEEISDSNPALNHPAAQPLIKGMMQVFAQKYPDASPKELNRLATDYLSNFGKLFQTDENAGLMDKTGIGKGATKPKETDWSQFG